MDDEEKDGDGFVGRRERFKHREITMWKSAKRALWMVFVSASLLLYAAGAPAAESVQSTASTETETSGASGASPERAKLGVGLRIGGIGFRHVRAGKLSWDDCRMNGTGLFVTYDLHPNFFVGLAGDFYHATGPTVEAGMERLSVYLLGSAGVRFLPEAVVSPYLQAGVGPEWTRIELAGATRSVVLAAPFMGLGGEVRLGSVRLGATLRSYAMGLPDHLQAGDQHEHAGGDDGVPLHYEPAAQVQFLARWVF